MLEEFTNSPLYTELLTDTDASYTALQLILENDEAYSLAIDERYEILGKINSDQYKPEVHDFALRRLIKI